MPLFELYDNYSRYGPVMASIPALLSRCKLILVASPSDKPKLPDLGSAITTAAAAVGGGGGDGEENVGGGAEGGVKQEGGAGIGNGVGGYGEEYEGVEGRG